MILHAPHVLRALRWIPPTAVLVGSTASYLTALALLWVVSAPLSKDLYARGERVVYSSYIALLGFFYETWSGVEVRPREYIHVATTLTMITVLPSSLFIMETSYR